MLAKSAQGDLPAPGLAVRPGLAAATGAGKEPPRICLLSAAGLWQEKPFTHEETRRKAGLIPREESQCSL